MTNTRLVGQHQPGQVLCPLEAGHQRHAAQRSVLFDLKKQFLGMRNTTQECNNITTNVITSFINSTFYNIYHLCKHRA